ncbi:MAG: bifunctional riboflavin kinase/FAD synthetase [Desulfovibrionaceae bacterium]|jgi:riboflavin kinase/FMN adenylyltransferase|nr:bifunctional riboflavin kinase/FAD synthetase [Desulfovibrionaceae bacterium]
MELVRDLQDITLDLSKGTCITIGNFDGVHKGHQALFTAVRHTAAAQGLASACVTFDPHPLRVLVGPHTPPAITVFDRKIELIDELGLDLTVILTFNLALASLEPEPFVKKYLVDRLNAKALVVGYDYTFGRGRKGDFAMLRALGEKYGFAAERLDPVIVDDAVVSSTRIRDLIQAGRVWEARTLLGRFYVVQGIVVKGQDRGGRLLGFPTANLNVANELHPKTGVYAVWAATPSGLVPGVANIGFNPTFGNQAISIEAHLLDFSGDLYGSKVDLHFVQRLRGEIKFEGVEALIAKIKEDVVLARQILASPQALL